MTLARYAVVFVLLSIAVLRHVEFELPSSATEGEQAIAGVLSELSSTELPTVQQYDELRLKAIAELKKNKSLKFSPPEWFLKDMKELSDKTAEEARVGFENASARLFSRQSGSAFDLGVEAVRRAMRGPDDDDTGTCPDCDGTGKVGDGRIFTECLACGGDGVIDDTDRKEEDPGLGRTSNQERSGDHISRGPTCDSVGNNLSSNERRLSFPRLRRLFGR